MRMRMKHAIGGGKCYRIVKDKNRLLKDRARDTIMEICCGLHNFRLQFRPWNYAYFQEEVATCQCQLGVALSWLSCA